LEDGFVAFSANLQNKVSLIDFYSAKAYSSSGGSQELFVVLLKNGEK